MPAADLPSAETIRHADGETLRVKILATGKTETLPRRKALGLLSLKRAELVGSKAAKKS